MEITIPDDITFSDLHLAYSEDGCVLFDTGVIERICEANGTPVEFILQGFAARLIVDWYVAHRREGGEPDAIAEELLAKANAIISARQ